MKIKNKRVLMTGNEAMAEGAIRAGCDCYFGYPITPQNEVTAYMARFMPEKGRVFIQAESELAAINMVFGAAAAGKRAMTSSSSPGISLKQEGISYIAGARLPAVIANVQRGGPGLGNIAPSQGDYFQATRSGGHGDYHSIVLAPASVQEMHNLTIDAFYLADLYRVPVIILADGRVGQMMEPIELFEGVPPQVPEKSWALTGAKGRKPNIVRSLLLEEGALAELNRELQKVYQQIQRNETKWNTSNTNDCSILVAAWGTCARIAQAAVEKVRDEGIKAGLFRPITLWPFPYEALVEASKSAKTVLVVEMNCGQMLEDIKIGLFNGGKKINIEFSGFPGGLVPTETDIIKAIRKIAER